MQDCSRGGRIAFRPSHVTSVFRHTAWSAPQHLDHYFLEPLLAHIKGHFTTKKNSKRISRGPSRMPEGVKAAPNCPLTPFSAAGQNGRSPLTPASAATYCTVSSSLQHLRGYRRYKTIFIPFFFFFFVEK